MSYRPPARYLPSRRRFPRYRRRGASPWAAAAVAGAVLVAASRAPAAAAHLHAARHGAPAGDRVTALVIAYARAQIGRPYLWGGTGPDAFDCSGLAMEAWRSAGVSIARTSQEQWATLPHVSSPRPGDLVFFPGSDGTWTSPGHVAIVISATAMIQAYATGTPIEVSPLSGDGAGGIVGYARPGAS